MNARSRRRPPASEEGFALIEVVVSAAVLVIVVLGVLAAVDAVSSTASSNQSKTVAATLAEKDLERLRAFKTSDLSDLPKIETETSKVKVGRITYTIVSKAQWVADSNGADISCALPSGSGSYLRITSTVSSPSARVKPVTMSSIVAPQPGQGTVTGLVRNAAGQPVKDLPVQAAGPSPDTLPTNAAGCAVFADSEAGSYTMRLNQTGWVDKDGKQLVEQNATVSAGNLTTVEFLYDKKSSFNAKVVTKRPGETALRDDQSTAVTAAHTGLSALSKTISTTSGTALNFLFDPMFPFTTPYQVYSGACANANPGKATSNPAYFDSHSESVVQLTPGGATVQTIAFEPAIDVTVTYEGSKVGGADVIAYPKTSGCTGKVDQGDTLSSGTYKGMVNKPGLPFGVWDVCAEITVTNGSRTRTFAQTQTNIANTNYDGTAKAFAFTWNGSTQATCA